MGSAVQRIDRDLGRAAVIARLRQILPALETHSITEALPFGIPQIDTHLPTSGLSLGALHEFTAADTADMPAAFGFVAALAGRALSARKGSCLLALSRRALANYGEPYGHGLAELGLPPDRLLLLETATDVQVLWAVEEALRLRAISVVAGWLGSELDLKASRRLQIAAEGSGALLLLLRPSEAEEANAATTRWRVSAVPAARDRFGCFTRWRWSIALERCRNGRPGAWIVESSDPELSHAAHPFGLVGTLADPALAPGAGEEPVRRAS